MLSLKTIKASLVLAVVALAGCGSSSSSTSKFVGTWQYSSGTFTLTFASQAPDTVPLTGTLILSKGVSSDLVYNASPCLFAFSVRGSDAQINPGASCVTTETDSNGNAFTLTLNPTIWTLSIGSALMNENGSGTCSAVQNGATFPCSFTQMATLTKISL